MRILKMSGAGNDFVVLDRAQADALADLPAWVRRVCRRGLSVGADGVLVVGEEDGSVRVRFYNPDGGEAFCGNGTRCAARFAAMRGWAGTPLTLRTEAGDVAAEVQGGRVRLRLPAPRDLGAWSGRAGGTALTGRRILAGVPHLVVEVADLAGAPLQQWGPALAHDPAFGTGGTNVSLVARRPDGAVGIRTWERGVEGETLACGSGAVAGAMFAALAGGGNDLTLVPASGIPLRVVLEDASALLEGDARLVFEGTLDDEAVSGFPSP